MNQQQTHHPEHHIGLGTYVAVFVALMVLLVVTVAMIHVDLGRTGGFIVAMLIASVKALLVMIYFMHLRTARALTRLFVVFGFFWFAILVVITLSDYLTRAGWPPRV
ncbi:MAG: hypothetical protein KatS3mg115_2370 [Candidatus Poribacteria bacterium]|nr:MAG: hypothetical protein KatS3mg115_2370 [Candidatus Poribacteria bacterium]